MASLPNNLTLGLTSMFKLTFPQVIGNFPLEIIVNFPLESTEGIKSPSERFTGQSSRITVSAQVGIEPSAPDFTTKWFRLFDH